MFDQFDFAKKWEQKLPNFSPLIVAVIRFVNVFKAHFFPMSFLWSFDVSNLVFKTGRNVAQFFPTSFCNDSIYQISLDKFFPQTFWADSMYQIRGKCCPIFHPELLGSFDVSNVVFRAGENAAQIYPMTFVNWFHCSNQGKMLPNFSPQTFWVIPLLPIRGKCCPIFHPELFGVIQCIKSCVCPRGKWCPIIHHEILGVIPIFHSEGYVAQFNGKMLSIFGG